MNIVTVIGVSVLGIISIISAYQGIKAYLKHRASKFVNYSDDISVLDELENEDVQKGESSFRKAISYTKEIKNPQSTLKPTITSFKGEQGNKEVKHPHTESTLRSAAIAFNKREQDRERVGSTDVWSPTTTHLFSSSYPDNNDPCDKGSIFDTGNSSFGSSFNSSSDSSSYSSSSGSSDSGSGGCE